MGLRSGPQAALARVVPSKVAALGGRPLDGDAFGWSVACPGRKPVQIRMDVRALVDWATATWSSYFPADRGYAVRVASPAGPSNGVQLQVVRGDFRASVSLESIREASRRGPQHMAVRMFGRAHSGALARVERRSHGTVQRWRNFGSALGIGAFVTLCWLSIGINNPVFVLGGLLMVVAALLTITAGATLGAWIGERIVEGTRARARHDVARDTRLEDDLKRWRALVKQLSAQRHAIAGRSLRAPFRNAPSELPEPSRPLPRLTPGSLSFSS